MSLKNSREALDKYTKPLPIEVVQLPQVYPGNPLSWLCAAGSFIWQVVANRETKVNVVYSEEDFCFKATNENDMRRLWERGFYGKGSLSRSEPTWLVRAEKEFLGKDEQEMTGEEIVKYRRELRDQYKRDRNKVLEQERQYKMENNLEKLAELEDERKKLAEQRDLISKARPEEKSQNGPKELRPEDAELVIDSSTIKNIEYLALTPCEALFLVYLRSVEIENPATSQKFTPVSLLKHLVEMFGDAEPENHFLIQFVVYFYYKSLGWCVKSGLKFSSDYVLYQRGPPFHHAAFAVTILKNSSSEPLKNWTHFGSIYRVVSAVKKAMVLCYVDTPSKEEFNEVWGNLQDRNSDGLVKLLNMYSIRELVYKRWTPSRTRV